MSERPEFTFEDWRRFTIADTVMSMAIMDKHHGKGRRKWLMNVDVDCKRKFARAVKRAMSKEAAEKFVSAIETNGDDFGEVFEAFRLHFYMAIAISDIVPACKSRITGEKAEGLYLDMKRVLDEHSDVKDKDVARDMVRGYLDSGELDLARDYALLTRWLAMNEEGDDLFNGIVDTYDKVVSGE